MATSNDPGQVQGSGLEEPRTYPGTYYQQHRNSILFSLAALLLAFPETQLKLTDLVFVQTLPSQAKHLVPWAALLAAFYSTAHFVVEWWDHAHAHLKLVRSHVDELSSELRKVLGELRSYQDIGAVAEAVKQLLERIASAPEWGLHRDPLHKFDANECAAKLNKELIQIWRGNKAEFGEGVISEGVEEGFVKDAVSQLTFSYTQELEKNRGGIERRVADYQLFMSRADALTRSMEALQSSLSSLTTDSNKLRALSGVELSAVRLRVWVLGFAPPVLLFLPALAAMLIYRAGMGAAVGLL